MRERVEVRNLATHVLGSVTITGLTDLLFAFSTRSFRPSPRSPTLGGWCFTVRRDP